MLDDEVPPRDTSLRCVPAKALGIGGREVGIEKWDCFCACNGGVGAPGSSDGDENREDLCRAEGEFAGETEPDLAKGLLRRWADPGGLKAIGGYHVSNVMKTLFLSYSQIEKNGQE